MCFALSISFSRGSESRPIIHDRPIQMRARTRTGRDGATTAGAKERGLRLSEKKKKKLRKNVLGPMGHCEKLKTELTKRTEPD